MRILTKCQRQRYCGRTERGSSKKKLFLLLMALLIASPALAQGIQVSGGIDVRLTNAQPDSVDNSDNTEHLRLEGAFLNLRKVWSDDLGDRWIGVAQADFDDNFQRIRPYQLYLQYKGPLGKWNIRGGHFLLPFGLLATFRCKIVLLEDVDSCSRSAAPIRRDSSFIVSLRHSIVARTQAGCGASQRPMLMRLSAMMPSPTHRRMPSLPR